MSTSTTQQPATRLSAARMCIALDKSGSTAGHILKVQRRAARTICELRAPGNQQAIRVLPWSDEVLDPISLPDDDGALDAVQGRGGTNPAILFDNEACVEAMREAGVWFLFTDGEIIDNLIERFAIRMAELRVHNKPCIVVVFGSSSAGPPAKANISVGIAAYAVAPDCLFLFHDLETGVLYLMQAKGRFRDIYPQTGNGQKNPLISLYTTWAELPQISYNDLRDLQVTHIEPLRPDQMVLSGGLVVQVDEVLRGNVDAAVMEQIVKDEDKLKSIIISSMTRGKGKDLHVLLEAQQKPIPDVDNHREDVEDGAKMAISKLLEALAAPAMEAGIDELRLSLRMAHQTNWDHFRGVRKAFNEERRAVRVHNNIARHGHLWLDQWSEGWGRNDFHCRDFNTRDDVDVKLEQEYDDSGRRAPVFLPGFQRLDHTEEFTGRCMLCHANRVLCLLFKAAPNRQTDNFPQVGTHVQLKFPLAMANFAEMDMLSFFVCCDWCGYFLERSATCPYRDDKPSFALCLVGLKENQSAWTEALDVALKGRFDVAELPLLLTAILARKTFENESRRHAAAEDVALFRACADWAVRQLAKFALVPESLSVAFTTGPAPAARVPLQDLVVSPAFADLASPENTDLLLLRYPVAGFPVLIRLLQLRGLNRERIQTLVFLRMAFHVTERVFDRRAAGASELFMEDVFGRESPAEGDAMQVAADIDPIEGLMTNDLLDEETLLSLRTMPEFTAVKSQTGPALKVFLYHLFKHSGTHLSPLTCFNSLKTMPTMQNVISAPLAISAGLSLDLIARA